MNILVTGAAGSIGSEACLYFLEKGYNVVGIDNFFRGELFGSSGNTEDTYKRLLKDKIDFYNLDITKKSRELIELVFTADVIIHTAAQPSHPRSIDIPELDKELNIDGTFNLLELVRSYNKNCMFLFTSTNKVYGENPNLLQFNELDTRYDYSNLKDYNGINESMSLDNTKHTPFGVSKVACDLYVQEYARTYGLITGIFRLGCITGSNAKAVELHNWEPFFVYKNLKGEELSICGFKGKQVRDVIHVNDFVRLLDLFIKNPKPGEIFNIGGGRDNSISLLESIMLIESITGKEMKYSFIEEREGDHKVYISDISKALATFPDWSINYNLQTIFTEIYIKQKDLLCQK